MPKGYLAFVLHAHLPYVRHPEHDSFLEERWFFEAVTETYIPLIKCFNRLIDDGVYFRINVSLSPTLLAMMEDPLLQDRYAAHLDLLIELCGKEMERTKNEPHFRYLADMYRRLFTEAREIFVGQCGSRLVTPFMRFHELGVVELMTTAATHGLLPLIAAEPKAAAAQISVGLDYFNSIFGFRPTGMWLPECGYYPGLDELLSREGVRYFIVESHGIEHADVTPFHGVYAPLYSSSGIAAFGRDRACTKQVWSAREGFPGDPLYREFYRDIGHDLDHEYVRPYIAGDVRTDTGIKYFRITGPTAWKEPYHPDAARERAAQHAGNFLHERVSHVEYLDSVMEKAPVIVAPFDAELFGHWWFEGPQWLELVIRKTAYDQKTLEMTTLSGYLKKHPVHQLGLPCTSTWGHKGYFEAWLNGKTDWIYPQIRECARRMEELALRYGKGRIQARIKRALNQCMRELLLAQSSDWPFIINNGTSEGYAVRRIKDHVSRFHHLAASIENNAIAGQDLDAMEWMDNIFPEVDFRVFSEGTGD